MRAVIAISLLILSVNGFADGFRVYNHTYKNNTQKCAVTIFVPDTGAIKIERLCFNISK